MIEVNSHGFTAKKRLKTTAWLQPAVASSAATASAAFSARAAAPIVGPSFF